MMSPEAAPPEGGIRLVERLASRGVTLRLRNDRIEWRPRGALSSADIATLRAHEATIAVYLAAGPGVRPHAGSAAARERFTCDPRPELPDTSLWEGVLALTYEIDGGNTNGLFGALHGLRCLGAQLVETDAGIGLVAGERSGEFAALQAAYLAPHAAALTAVFARIARTQPSRASREGREKLRAEGFP